jgi:hypothetical protein
MRRAPAPPAPRHSRRRARHLQGRGVGVLDEWRVRSLPVLGKFLVFYCYCTWRVSGVDDKTD